MRRCLLFAWVSLHACSSVSHAQSYMPLKNDASMRAAPAAGMQSYAFPLKDVTLLESPFRRARSLDSSYLLLLKPDRLLHRFHRNAGLPVRDSVYGGWESEGLSGHTLGHYLSAASMMYASTGDEGMRQRVSYLVSELARCQKARGTGYVGAIPGEDSLFARVSRGDVKSSGFDLNGAWSPWYTVHKLLAGLLDAALHTGNGEALEIARGLGDWTIGTVGHLPDSVRLRMLDCEYGGMNESMANLYAMTGAMRYLEGANLFRDEAVMGRLARRIDPMPGRHSNTNVPKALSAARQYELRGESSDSTIAAFFWETMTRNHTYVIGGNSNYEYCGEPGRLNDRLSDNTCETCNTYNMLKLTGHLFAWKPSARLGDYYERALYNHILASQHPATGMTTYFMPLRMGSRKAFSDSFDTFTCCVGSGLENHAKYNECIYFEEAGGGLIVNLFIPSALDWKSRGMGISMEASPSGEHVSIRIRGSAKSPFRIRIRKPAWAFQEVRCRINGRPFQPPVDEAGFLTMERLWKDGDRIELYLPMSLYTESMPDNSDRVAFLFGPWVLAGRLGREMPDPVFGTPVIMSADRTAANWTKRTGRDSVAFRWQGVGRPTDATLVPLHQVNDEHFSVYWDFFKPEAWETRRSEYEAELRRRSEVDARTIDDFRIGEMQPERDHRLEATERSYVSEAVGRQGREARSGHGFGFTMRVDPQQPMTLLITCIGDDRDRVFDILADGERLATVDWKGGQTGRFYDISYRIPEGLTKGKGEIRIRVEANHGKTAGRIFGVRTLRD